MLVPARDSQSFTCTCIFWAGDRSVGLRVKGRYGTRTENDRARRAITELTDSLLLPAPHGGAATAAGSGKMPSAAAPCRIPLRGPFASGLPGHGKGIR